MTKENSPPDIHQCECSTCGRYPHGSLAREHRRINRLVAAADEPTQRLLVGFLARQQGRGGIALMARITGLDPKTIARGQRELRQRRRPKGSRLRRPGAGRPRAEKKVRPS